MGRRLILVRHGRPQVLAGTAAAEWPLSEGGRERSLQLARKLGRVSGRTIYSSVEPKAVETAKAIGDVLDLPVTVADGLHEHDRRGTPLLDAAEFEAALRSFFASPAECVFGRESADAADARFRRAVTAMISTDDSDDLIVVAHGTVMALFLAPVAGLQPLDLWHALSMPCAAIVHLPAWELDRILAVK